jgi:hypothetical protein
MVLIKRFSKHAVSQKPCPFVRLEHVFDQTLSQI